MFNRTTKNDDIDNQDVNDLADSLKALLKSYGSEAMDEVDSARSQAQALLKQTRAKMNGGHNRVSQAARDAGY
nr:membrane protein [Candidatus Pantoea persica]